MMHSADNVANNMIGANSVLHAKERGRIALRLATFVPAGCEKD
jgi:hypothetical protein